MGSQIYICDHTLNTEVPHSIIFLPRNLVSPISNFTVEVIAVLWAHCLGASLLLGSSDDHLRYSAVNAALLTHLQ